MRKPQETERRFVPAAGDQLGPGSGIKIGNVCFQFPVFPASMIATAFEMTWTLVFASRFPLMIIFTHFRKGTYGPSCCNRWHCASSM